MLLLNLYLALLYAFLHQQATCTVGGMVYNPFGIYDFSCYMVRIFGMPCIMVIHDKTCLNLIVAKLSLLFSLFSFFCHKIIVLDVNVPVLRLVI